MRTSPARAYAGTLPPDARSEAMGGAFTAVAEGASAAFWNPGALVQGDAWSVMPFSYLKLGNPDGRDGLYSAGAAAHRRGMGIGVYLSYFDSEPSTPQFNGDTVEEYTSSLAYGIDMLRWRERPPAWLSWGLGASLDISHLDLRSSEFVPPFHRVGTGTDVGLGTLLVMSRPWVTRESEGIPPRHGFASLRLGATVRNVLERRIALGGGARELHLSAAGVLGFGKAHRLGPGVQFLLAIERQIGGYGGSAVGAEVTILGILSLRAGGEENGLGSVGLGVCYPFSGRYGARFDVTNIGDRYGATANHHFSLSGWMRL